MTGRVWFITGASRGIGALTVEAALAAGDRVVATGRSTTAMAQRFGERDGLLLLSMDVTDRDAIATAVTGAIAHFGGIDIVLNNAGYGLLGSIEETSQDELHACMNTNFFGTLWVCQEVVPHMRERRSGHILNVTSVGGMVAMGGFGIYCAAKFGIEAISEALGQEVAGFGVHVTAVEPGYVKSDFLEGNSLVITHKEIADYADTSGAARRAMEQNLISQPGDPAKVAEAIVAITRVQNPPRWLPLGADAYQAINGRLDSTRAEIEKWRDLGCSTFFDEPADSAA